MQTVDDRDPRVARGASIAIPFLGVLAALQMTAVGINSDALSWSTSGLNVAGIGTPSAISLVSVAAAATVVSAGLLADRIGRRRVLIAGLLMGAVGCALAALTSTAMTHLTAQVLAGIGFGAVFGAAFAYVHTVASAARLAADLGIFGAAIGVASLTFSFAAEALPANDGRAGFLVVVAASIVCAVLVPSVLPDVPVVRGAPSDWIGQGLLAVGIASFLVGLSHVGMGSSSLVAWISIVLGLTLLLGFYVFESNSPNAFFPTDLFESARFMAAVLAGLIYSFGFAAAIVAGRSLWQFMGADSTTDLPLWQLPLVLAMLIGAVVTGRMMSHDTAVRGALFVGSILTALGLVALAAASRESSFIACLPGLVLVGAGTGGMSIPFGYLIIRVAPSTAFGPVTGTRVALGEFGYAIGVALMALLLSTLTLGDGYSHALTVSLGVAAFMILVAGAVAAHLLRGTDVSQ